VDYQQDWGSVFVEYQSINDNLNLPGSISAAQEAIDRKHTNTPFNYFNTDTTVARVGGDIKLSDTLSLAAEYSDRDSDGTGFQFGSDFTQDTRVKSFTPRLLGQWDTDNGPWLLTLGYDQEDSKFDYKQPGIFYFLSNEQRIKAAYTQLVIPLAKGLSMTTGLRNSQANDENFINGLKNDESELATEIGVSWQINQENRVFLRNADGFRFATVDENGLTPPSQTFLDPQTSNSWDLGYEWSNGEHGIKALAYDMELENEIIYDPFVPNVWFPGANVNLDKSNRRGVIVDGYYSLTDALTLRANYTYTDAKITSGVFDGNHVPFVAENVGTLAAEWAVMDNVSIYVDGQYTGSRYPANDDGNIANKISSFWIYNANVRWTPGQWDINVRANNLSGEKYNSYESLFGMYPAAEATAEVRVGYTF
jgi:iron complex outermembrane receptor protein